ncbi:MAG: glycosyltransferase [Acidobacteriota bacterium]
MAQVLNIIQQLSLGGASRSLIAIAKYLMRGGHYRCRVASLLAADREAVKLASEAGLEIIEAPSRALLRKEIANADLVQLNWWNTPEMDDLMRSELPPARLVVWCHVAGDGEPQIITNTLVDFSDVTVATNPWTYGNLPVFKNLSRDAKSQRVAMIYDAADLERVRDIRRQPHLQFNVGYIGTVSFVKMHPEFVAMSSTVRIPDVRFVVCGGGVEATLREQAVRLGSVDKFQFHGYVKDIRPVLEVMDVYGYPLCEKTYASGELNLQEVMACGIPPVVFPYGGVKQLVINEYTGLVVESTTEYRDALEYLYHNPRERERLGSNAREYARQIFGAENAAQKLHLLYGRILSHPKQLRFWGRRPGISLLDQPITMRDLTGERSTGAERFIESLGGMGTDFEISLRGTQPDLQLKAEAKIATSSELLYSSGVRPYRNFYTHDPHLRLWCGLVLQHSGKPKDACTEFASAIDLGLNHWRTRWYLAQAAQASGDYLLAEKSVLDVIAAAPYFDEAQRFLESLRPFLSSRRSPGARKEGANDLRPERNLRLQAYEKGNPSLERCDEEIQSNLQHEMNGHGYSVSTLRAKPVSTDIPSGRGHTVEVTESLATPGRPVRSVRRLTLEAFRHAENGLWQQALDCLDAVLEQAPTKQGIQFLRARCLEQLGRLNEAAAAARAELAVQPGHPDALALLQRLPRNEESSAQAAATGWQVPKTIRTAAFLDSQPAGSTVQAEDSLSPDSCSHRTQTGSAAPVVNHAFLDRQREFWNVATIEEAAFERVYCDRRLENLSPEERWQALKLSGEKSVEAVLKNLPARPDWSILELGCGIGRVIKPLRKRFERVDGVDISEKMIQFASRYLADDAQNGALFLNNGCDLKPLADSQYDLVYSIIVFQHIRSISVVRSYLREIARVLKPGGYFRLQVYDKTNPSLGSYDEEALPNVQHGMTGNGYSVEELCTLLTEHGYDIIETEHSSPWLWITARTPESACKSPTATAVSRAKVGSDWAAARNGSTQPHTSPSVGQVTLEAFHHFENGAWSLALDSLDSVLKQTPEKQGIQFLRARCLEQLGRLNEALAAARAELAVQPGHPDALALLQRLPRNEESSAQAAATGWQASIRTQLDSRQFDKALTLADEVMSRQSSQPELHYLRAVALEALGQLDGAQAAVRKELELQPNHLEARRLFHRLRVKTLGRTRETAEHKERLSAGGVTSTKKMDRYDPAALSLYSQPPVGNTEKYIQLQLSDVIGDPVPTHQGLRDYVIRDFGKGLPAAEAILKHIIEHTLRRTWQPTAGLWNTTVLLPVRSHIWHRITGQTFDRARTRAVRDIHSDFAQSEGPQRVADIERYAARLAGGENLGPALFVTGAVLNELGGKTDPKSLYMMDGARRLVAAALNGWLNIPAWLLMHEEEYGALLRQELRSGLQERVNSLGWFKNYQSIPLVGLNGERTLQRFGLMDLSLLQDQVVVDFGCNLGQSSLKAALAGARQVLGIEGMPDTYRLACEIQQLSGLQNLHYLNVDFNDPEFDRTIDAQLPDQADYSFFFSVYRTKELVDRDRLFRYIRHKTRKGIFFEGHAHPKIDTLEYYEWLFQSFGLEYRFLGHSEGRLRPLFFLDLSPAAPRNRDEACPATTSQIGTSSNALQSRGDTDPSEPPLTGQPPSHPGPSSSAPKSRDAKPQGYLVSAIVSTYRAERFIEGRLQDLLQQSLGERLEIIVVDSNSPEIERAIVERYCRRHPNIQYLRTDVRENVYQAWNRGIKAASGQYVTNANTDDRLRSDALEVLAEELNQNPNVALVYADFLITGTENMTLDSHIRTGYSRKPDYDPSIMLAGCHMGPQPMWRRSIHDEIGYFDESFEASGDYEFWCRLALRYPMKHVPQFLGLYLHNANGVSNGNLERSLREARRVQEKYAGRLPAPAPNLPTGFYFKEPVEPGRYVNIGMVTYNRLEFTRRSIEALLKNTRFPYVLTVVDNHSQDGTVEYLKQLKREGIIKNLVLLTENVGVAKASNLAWQMEEAAAYYLKLDNDIVIQKPDWLDQMVEVIDDLPQLGAVAYNFEPVSYPVHRQNGHTVRIKDGTLGGACFLVPRRTHEKLGFWCEDYGLYGEEDFDFSHRLQFAGLQTAYMEDEDVGLHLPGGKAGEMDGETRRAQDEEESRVHAEYREWKDQLRIQLRSDAGLVDRNLRAYRSGERSLYVPRGVLLGRVEPGIQVFDQTDALLFLDVAGEMTPTTRDQLLDWIVSQDLDRSGAQTLVQHGRTMLRVRKTQDSNKQDCSGEWERLWDRAARLMDSAQWLEALEVLNALPAAQSHVIEIQYAKARCWFGLDRLDDAEGAVRALLSDHPDHQPARDLFHQIRLKRASHEAAVEVPGPIEIPGRRLGGNQVTGPAVPRSARPPFSAQPLTVTVLTYDLPGTACGSLRIQQPLARQSNLRLTYGLEIEKDRIIVQEENLREADLIVVQRSLPGPESQQTLDRVLALGKPIIYELDDLLTEIPPTNPHHVPAMHRRYFLERFMSKATVMTVSTPELKATLTSRCKHIFVLPNLIDESLWKQPSPVSPEDTVVVGYTGTATHLFDLRMIEEALVRIAGKYKNRVAFRFMGSATERIAQLPGFQFVSFEMGYAAYAETLQKTPMDIALAPLQDNAFNRCKSHIKWLEYSACGIPGVYSDLPPYRSQVRPGETGLLAGPTTEDWLRAIDQLISDKVTRRKMAERTRNEVLSKHTLAACAWQYGEVYRQVWKSFHDGIASTGQPNRTADRQPRPMTLEECLLELNRLHPELTPTFGRVERYSNQGRVELAARIIQKELSKLPEASWLIDCLQASNPTKVPEEVHS